jgi:DNA-binding transcriptional LysR family regulator
LHPELGMTLAQLRYFLAIVDAGLNITAAADRVHATQPGLSKQLKLLEEELGVNLFVRRGRSLVQLTAAGQEIVERARIIATEADNIRALVANQRGEHDGTLFIETTQIHGHYVLPPALTALREAFPNVDVGLGFAADADDIARRNPDSDLCIFSTDGRRPLGDVTIPLYRWHPVALVPQDHPLANPDVEISLQSLARFPLVTYDTSTTAPLSIAQTFLNAGFTPRFAYTLRDAGAIKQAVLEGLGVGLLAEMGVDPQRDAGLVARSLTGLFPQCTAWAVLQRDRVLRDYLVHLLVILSGLSARQIHQIAIGDAVHDGESGVLIWAERQALLRALKPQSPSPQLVAAAPLPVVELA